MRLWRDGLSFGEIALRLRLPRTTVGSIIRAARERGELPAADAVRPDNRLGRPFNLRIDDRRVVRALEREARRRDVSLGTVARRLLATCAQDRLFDAVLDDGGMR
ncbi:hypothetical protein L0F51_04050 [Afifella sp. H1R]|uniref:hypothetical protein n=1 Tax=Afifella sp. H1R TaxID=2908841 RepID=UPI001F3B4635|nr:hypothetical protein [Afifella sp. H1R]MCF1502937.1 hypothetical protein [Afifella sp. H1R]